jgi:hypothetical protein
MTVEGRTAEDGNHAIKQTDRLLSGRSVSLKAVWRTRPTLPPPPSEGSAKQAI